MIPKSISLVLALFTLMVLAVSSGGVLQTVFAQDELIFDILGGDRFAQCCDELIFDIPSSANAPPPDLIFDILGSDVYGDAFAEDELIFDILGSDVYDRVI